MLSIGIYWDRIRESEAPKIHVMGLRQWDRKEKKKHCRDWKKYFFCYSVIEAYMFDLLYGNGVTPE